MGNKAVYSSPPHTNVSNMQENISRNVASAQQKFNQRNECWNAPSIFDGRFITINTPWNQYSIHPNPDTFGDCGDMLVKLPTPYRIIFVSNIQQGFGADFIFLSLFPLSLSYAPGGTFVSPFPNGGENFFSLTGATRIDRPTPFIEFTDPISEFFLHLSIPSGSQYRLTLCATNDSKLVKNLGYIPS